MKQLNITIELENEAFIENMESEITRILHEAIESINDWNDSIVLRDINGNKVWYCKIN